MQYITAQNLDSHIQTTLFEADIKKQRIVNYLDNLQAKINTLRELQSETKEELDALMPSILDKAFKGEL